MPAEPYSVKFKESFGFFCDLYVNVVPYRNIYIIPHLFCFVKRFLKIFEIFLMIFETAYRNRKVRNQTITDFGFGDYLFSFALISRSSSACARTLA